MKSWCVSAMFVMLLISAASVHAEPLAVGSLAGVEAFARGHSPRLEAIRAEGTTAIEEVRQSVVGSNPDLGLEQEATGEEVERFVTLGKEFRTPWMYSQQRQWRKAELDWLRTRTTRSIEEAIADLQTQYVELAITQARLKQLETLAELLDSLRTVVDIRASEGFEAIVDAQLIASSLASVRARTALLRQEFQVHRAVWQLDMGMDSEMSAEFVLPTIIANIDFPPDTEILSAIETGPLWNEILAYQAVQDNRVSVQRAAWLPSLGVEGGFKQVEDGDAGYVIGLSIPLPLLDRNSHATQAAEAKARLASLEIRREQLRLQATLESSVATLVQLRSTLDDYPILANSYRILFASLHEGWIDVPSALSSLQGILDADEMRGELSLSWFSTLFQVELMTSMELMTSVSETEGDR
jgi:outer membrane protein TolC